MIELKLDPRDFRVIDAWTFNYKGYAEDTIIVEVAPGYFCDLYISEDEQGPYALPAGCSDGVGYIYTDDYGRNDGTAAIVSDEDMWSVEEFAEDYYAKHPEKFDPAE